MDPRWLQALGPAANSLGFAGLALLAITGLAWAVRTLWRAFLDEQAKGGKRDALILDQETEHQRLLVRFEESMERLRILSAKVELAEERNRQLEDELASHEGGRPPAARTRRRP